MSIWDRCTINDGTESKMYELYRICHNALRTVLQGSVNVLKFMSQNIYFILPGQTLVIPVVLNGVFSIPELPKTKVWALKTEWYDPWTGNILYSRTDPLFKHSYEDIWREVVEPIDVPISGSEYFLYRDENGIRQGYNFYGEGKHKYFMMLADGGPLVRDTSIIMMFAWLLGKLGLFNLVSKFINAVCMNMSNSIQKRRVKNINKLIKDIDLNLDNYILSENTSDGIIVSTLNDVKDSIGVRHILR